MKTHYRSPKGDSPAYARLCGATSKAYEIQFSSYVEEIDCERCLRAIKTILIIKLGRDK